MFIRKQHGRAEKIFIILARPQAVPAKPSWSLTVSIVCPQRQVIHIMKTDVIALRSHDGIAAVQELASVECLDSMLLDDVDLKSNIAIDFVMTKIIDHVRNEFSKVSCALSIRHNYRKAFICLARQHVNCRTHFAPT